MAPRNNYCCMLLVLLLSGLSAVLLVEITKDISAPIIIGRTVCAVYPLGNGFYYGVNLVTYEEAANCCEKSYLGLAEASPKATARNYSIIKQSLMSTVYYEGREPFGKHGGIHIRSKTENYTSHNCTVLFLTSKINPEVKILQNQECHFRRHFLCKDEAHELLNCSIIKYTQSEGTRVVVGNSRVSWRMAATCCNKINKTLVRLRPGLVKKLGLSGELWTNLHRPMSSPFFYWPQTGDPLNFPDDSKRHRREFCISATIPSTKFTEMFKEKPCESKLRFACSAEIRVNLSVVGNVTLPWQKISVPGGSNQVYMYSPGSLSASFENAKTMCETAGLTLLTAIVPSEGDALAEYLRTIEGTGDSMATSYWIGAKATGRGEKKFQFYNVTGSPTLMITDYDDTTQEQVPRFGEGEGDCLEFEVSGGTTGEFLIKPLNCEAQRGVLCQKLFHPTGSIFIGIGNRYFYSKVKMTYQDALEICEKNDLRLFLLRDEEESRVVIEAISQFASHNNYAKGFWSGPKRYKLPLYYTKESYVDWAPPRRKADRRTFHMMYQGEAAAFTRNDTLRWCHVAFWIEKLVRGKTRLVMKQWKKKCDTKANFVCERLSRDACEVEEIPDQAWLSKSALDWNEARDCCDHLPNHELVSVEDFDSLKKIKDEASTTSSAVFFQHLNFWTAGSNAAGSMAFLSSSYFHEGIIDYEPVPERNQCLEAYYEGTSGSFRLSHHACDKEKQFICTSRKQIHVPCKKVLYQRIGRSSYFLAWDKMPWSLAATCCRDREGILAKIKTKKQLDSIYREMLNWPDGPAFANPSNVVWIGLAQDIIISKDKEDDENDDHFWWLDGRAKLGVDDEKDMNIFDDDELGLDCVGLSIQSDEGIWKAVNCSEKHWSLCYARHDLYGFGGEIV